MVSRAFIARVVAVAMSRCVQSFLPKTDRLAPQPHYTDDAYSPQPSGASRRSKFVQTCTAFSFYKYSQTAFLIYDRHAHRHIPIFHRRYYTCLPTTWREQDFCSLPCFHAFFYTTDLPQNVRTPSRRAVKPLFPSTKQGQGGGYEESTIIQRLRVNKPTPMDNFEFTSCA